MNRFQLNLKRRTTLIDVLIFLGLLIPAFDFIWNVRPEVVRLTQANYVLKELTVAMTTLSRFEPELKRTLYEYEKSPEMGPFYSVESVFARIQGAFGNLYSLMNQVDPVLDHLTRRFLESEFDRVTRIIEAFDVASKDAADIQNLRDEIEEADMLHLAIMTDFGSYLRKMSLDYTDQVQVFERRIYLSTGFALIFVGILLAYRTWFIRRRVLDPLERVHRAQLQLQTGRFPGAITFPGHLDPEVQSIVDSFNETEKSVRHMVEYTSVFTSAFVHDLKEPLVAILSLESLITFKHESHEESPMLGELLEFSGRVRRNSEWCLGTIDNLLQYTRGSLNKVDPKSIPLRPLAREVFEMGKSYFPTVQAKLLLGEEIGVLHADEAQWRSVLRSLMNQSFRAAQGRHEPLEIRIDLWNQRSDSGANGVMFAYFDSCTKASPELLSHLERGAWNAPDVFSQETTKNLKMLGLGMAIFHRIVTAHRGQMSLDTRPGSLLEVRAWLPLLESLQ